MSYSSKLPLMVLAYKNNHDAAVAVPAGKMIEIIGPDEDDRFVIVNVDGEEFLVFETDLVQLAAA
jgi:hypothetical protein